MSLKGGYKILDLSKNPSYTEIAKVLNTEKAVLISGLIVEGVRQKDCFASVEENEGVYTLKTPDVIVTINESQTIISKESSLKWNSKELTSTEYTISGNYIEFNFIPDKNMAIFQIVEPGPNYRTNLVAINDYSGIVMNNTTHPSVTDVDYTKAGTKYRMTFTGVTSIISTAKITYKYLG